MFRVFLAVFLCFSRDFPGFRGVKKSLVFWVVSLVFTKTPRKGRSGTRTVKKVSKKVPKDPQRSQKDYKISVRGLFRQFCDTAGREAWEGISGLGGVETPVYGDCQKDFFLQGLVVFRLIPVICCLRQEQNLKITGNANYFQTGPIPQ